MRRVKVTFRVLVIMLPFLAIALGEQQVVRVTYREYVRRSSATLDMPERLEERLTPLQSLLPAYGRIGYVDPDHSWLNAQSTRTFYLTQFVIAPRVLVFSPQPDIVLYSSHRGRPLTDADIPPGMRVLSQIHPDLAVLTRVPR